MLHTLPASYQASADPRYESMISSEAVECEKVNWSTCKCEDANKNQHPLTLRTVNTLPKYRSKSSSTLPYIHSILLTIVYALIH